MLSDFDTVMMVAILVAAILRSSAYTSLCAIAYLIQWFTSDLLSDELYYMSAIIIDSALVAAGTIGVISKTDRAIQLLNSLFVAVNAYGFAIWYFYISPETYNMACSVVYAAILLTITTGRKQREQRGGHIEGDWIRSVGDGFGAMLRQMGLSNKNGSV